MIPGITVTAWKQVVTMENFDKEPEELENLGLKEYTWTKTRINIYDVEEIAEYNSSKSSKKSVIYFFDSRHPMIVKEDFEDLIQRLEEKNEEERFKNTQAEIVFEEEEESSENTETM